MIKMTQKTGEIDCWWASYELPKYDDLSHLFTHANKFFFFKSVHELESFDFILKTLIILNK